ncbi:hypothetical protein K458DRAFT_395748 [Lentithecium fluviatile CBS 122367]|uniref:Uncharacterized protein n=1 Tax=Lentithecium fluviatile CBS 122367 TaxID=1168545 RepID=A0A6G1IIF1_9PLEO|nr:hypothetical protein K458DRAFT_395748 [Lentithecium fluviatile CBS 122367]
MGDTDITFDQHFFGFTQLYTPKPGTLVTADIIAITGLDGHAYGSWRGKGNLGRMWLRDFLCKDLPCCRTMIYGYNSMLSTHEVDTIMDYSRGLIEELKKVRNTEELRQRPPFFVAHSFGGIILAHCLVKAVLTTEDDHPTIAALHRATYSMLLFGIPHRGLVVDDIQRMLIGHDSHPRNALLAQIRKKSNLLASQLDDFRNLVRDRKVVSFYETRQTKQLQFLGATDTSRRQATSSQQWTPTQHFSSSLTRWKTKIPLDADHSMMVKFDIRNARGYSSARDKLRQFQQNALNVVAARFWSLLVQTQNRPRPSTMVPFQRGRAFVGRRNILARIEEKNKQAGALNHSRIALVGLGGVGKSQIAIEYAYRVRESASPMWVFWVHASNAARFEQAYRNIAAKVELPSRDDPEANILRLVHNWLCDERNGRWLMVVDNADDHQVFHSPYVELGGVAQGAEPIREAAPLVSFLPQTAHGWILVTSRDLVTAMNLVGTRRNVIQVEPMGEQDALALLKTKVQVDESSEGDVRALIKALEGIPLAVTHMAAYLAVREPRVTCSTYLELFRASEENQTYLLNSQEARDIRRDAIVSDAVITTWQISFEQIRKTRPEAADVISLMSMFDRQGAPEQVLYKGRTRLQFEEAVAPLTSFSLIRTQTGKQPGQPSGQQLGRQLFEMHSLVQLATKKWLELHSQVNIWKKASLRIMAAAFPSGQHETCLEEDEAMLDQALVATNTAWYLMLVGEYVTAEGIGRSAAVVQEKVLGREHPDTLTSVSQLGSVLLRQGKYDEAEAMHRRALEGNEKVLGRKHPDTLTSVYHLAFLFHRQHHYTAARELYKRAYDGDGNEELKRYQWLGQ